MSGIATGTALMIGGGLGAAGGIAGAAISSHAAGKAADAQTAAANYAADRQYQASQDALNFQKQQWNTSQQQMAPWLNAGRSGLSNLQYLMGIGQNPGASVSGGPQSFMGARAGGPIPVQGGPIGVSGVRAQASPGSGAQGVMPPLSSMGNPSSGPQPISGIHLAGGPRLADPSQPVNGTPTGAIPVRAGAMPVDMPMGGSMSQMPGQYGDPSQFAASQPNYQPQTDSGMSQMTGVQTADGMPAPNTDLGAFGSLMQANPYSTFTAPTGLTEQNDPGYQARLKLGTDAMQRSAAARGGLLTGGTAQALDQFGQDYGSNEYDKAYNRAFNTNAYNYNSFNNNQQNQFNRLAAISGMGQTSAGQLGYLGNSAAQGVTNNLLSTAGMMGQDYNNAAAATASGYVGSANAWGGALNGVGNNLTQLMMLKQLGMGGGGYSSSLDGFQGMGA